jgi:hypothetical protein
MVIILIMVTTHKCSPPSTSFKVQHPGVKTRSTSLRPVKSRIGAIETDCSFGCRLLVGEHHQVERHITRRRHSGRAWQEEGGS